MAAVTALTSPQDSVAELTTIYEKRRNTLYNGLSSLGWEAPLCKGTFFCWLPVPKGFHSVTFSDYLLEKADIALAPGTGFGAHGEGYVRLALLTDEHRLEEFLSRVEKLNLSFLQRKLNP